MIANGETVFCGRAMRRKRLHLEQVKKGEAMPLARRKSSLPREREQWRRKTSMTLDLEPFMDDRERKEGLRRLVKWIEVSVKNSKIQNPNSNENGKRKKEKQQTAEDAENSRCVAYSNPQSAIRNPKSDERALKKSCKSNSFTELFFCTWCKTPEFASPRLIPLPSDRGTNLPAARACRRCWRCAAV